jgi:hypothetical protein
MSPSGESVSRPFHSSEPVSLPTTRAAIGAVAAA